MSSRRPSLLAICREGNYAQLKVFVRQNPRNNAYRVYDNHMHGPLHHAVASQSYPCLALLLSSRHVDIRVCTYEGYSCLFLAIIYNSTTEIIELLLDYDPELFQIPNNEQVWPMHKAILMGSFRMVQAMVTKLQAMRIIVPAQFDLEGEDALFLTARTRQVDVLLYLIEHLHLDYNKTNRFMYNALKATMIPVDDPLLHVDSSDETSLQMIQILFPLTYDRNAENLIEMEVTALIAIACTFRNLVVYDWLIEEFYLVSSNEHRALIRRLLDALTHITTTLELQFAIRMIVIGLHTKVRQFRLMSHHSSRILYLKLIPAFQILYDHDQPLFYDMLNVIRGKMIRSLNLNELSIPDDAFIAPDLVESTVRMFNILEIGSLPYIDTFFSSASTAKFYCNALLLLMPFAPFALPPTYALSENLEYSEILPEEDAIMAKYDVSESFPSKICLKSMCRIVIRKRMLGGTVLRHAEKLSRFRSLHLPSSIFDFLLYNYTGYNFE